MACNFFLIDTFYVSSCLTIDMHVVYHIKFLHNLRKGSYAQLDTCANLGGAFPLDMTYLKPFKNCRIYMAFQLCDVHLPVLPSFCIFTTF